MLYQVKSDFEVTEIGEDFMVIPRGGESIANPCVLVFNETGAFLWRILEKGVSLSQLEEALCGRYGINMERAILDVKDFLQKMKEHNLLEQE